MPPRHTTIDRDGAGVGERQRDSSLDLRPAYTSEYYLTDCGGYDSYILHRGRRLEEPRLETIAAICGLQEGGRALDLGCGRGELTYHLASEGFAVTAVDYSADAIALAEECFPGGDPLRSRVEFLCGDAATVPLTGSYDLVVAADLVEHLSVGEVEALYRRVAEHLAPGGTVVLHTYPNLWYYRYGHPRRVRAAASAGERPALEPRTPYELLMHINEQSPAVMARQLRASFAHVLLWFGDWGDPGRNLVERFTREEMRSAPDLFAVAGNVDVHQRLARRTRMSRLDAPARGDLEIAVVEHPPCVEKSAEFRVNARVTNRTASVLNSFPPHPVHLAYHWLGDGGGTLHEFEGLRSRLVPVLEAGRTRTYDAKVRAPAEAGSYVLRLTLVQEHVRWLDEPPALLASDVVIAVE